MEFFPDGHHVRLRSRVHGAYLHAEEDGVGVSLRPRRARASLGAAWLVRRILRDGTTCFLLQGAAYGRYLVASLAAAPPGHRGRLVGVRDHNAEEIDAMVWKAVRAGDGDYVLVRNVSNDLLRANGRYRPWLTGVTVDEYANLSTMMHWVVEAIPMRATPLPIPGEIQEEFFLGPPLTGLFAGLLRRWRGEPPVGQRTIRFVRTDPYGNFDEAAWSTFQFEGRSVFRLKMELAQRVGEAVFFFAMVACVRAGLHGGLIPLSVDLPRSGETMDIVMLTIGTPAAAELRHPDIDAP
ncbi:hypothetical protein ACP70R_042345 [Stipagrostis hirtigluma subsp. patula]